MALGTTSLLAAIDGHGCLATLAKLGTKRPQCKNLLAEPTAPFKGLPAFTGAPACEMLPPKVLKYDLGYASTGQRYAASMLGTRGFHLINMRL